MTIENTGEYKEWLSKVQINGFALQGVPDALKTEVLCLTAVKKSGDALQYVPKTLKTEGICLAAVQQAGWALRYVPEFLKTEAVCLAAVQKNGLALQYVPEVLKTESICLAAVQKNGLALKYVPEVLKTEALSLVAVKKSGDALEYVIRPTDQLAADAEQLAIWNRILMQVDETDPDSKGHLQVQLISPLMTQVNKTSRLPAPVLDEIAILVEHCERLRVDIDPIKELYCENQQMAKPQSKHRLSASVELCL